MNTLFIIIPAIRTLVQIDRYVEIR